MGRQIIKQPNGKFAIWSTIVDNFIMLNATAEEYIAFRIEEESARIRREIPEIIDKLNSGKNIGFYDYTWESSLDRIFEIHGDEAVKKTLEEVENDVS